MSNNLLNLIPSSPYYIPTEKDAQKAVEYLNTIFPLADSISIEQNTHPYFIDPGTNLEKITCPNCKLEINHKWWLETMDAAYKNGFMNLEITPPCCKSATSLNDLKYDWPAGFAQFCIKALNPNKDLSEIEIGKVATILGTDIKKVLTHY